MSRHGYRVTVSPGSVFVRATRLSVLRGWLARRGRASQSLLIVGVVFVWALVVEELAGVFL